MRSTTAVALTLTVLTSCRQAADATPEQRPTKPAVSPTKPKPKPIVTIARDDKMYTTYFYTAAEAVIHGYEKDTKVRIVSLSDPSTKRQAGTIWEGTVGLGETRTIPTGAGVYGLLSDKKAAILVGTPSSCAVVGYFLKDQDGKFRSNRFFTQLPSSAQMSGERVIVWAYDGAEVEVRNPKTQKVLATKTIEAGGRLVLDKEMIGALGNQVIEIVSTKNTVGAQVYYDQGFIVPSVEGHGAGRDFYTFAGHLTAGSNDLDIIAGEKDAKVTVTDLETGKALFTGTVPAGKIKVLELVDKYVRVTSDNLVQVQVAAFERNGTGYAEHHFGTGREGGGIDNDFKVTTSGGLWLFSYFAANPITVKDTKTGKIVFEGKLDAGSGRELTVGGGLFHVHSGKGMSVMGGASTCGADYSPAAGLFAVDDAMLNVIQQVAQARVEAAAARGVTLTPEAAAAAPLSQKEWDDYGAPAKASGYRTMSVDEANERATAIKKKK
ncbi:MAG: hypothetical protein H0T46_21215 [Deltaproteobacteria bacterium]|nr:hypothetical protein [Deltaproteobacteria bacterium]